MDFVDLGERGLDTFWELLFFLDDLEEDLDFRGGERGGYSGNSRASSRVKW